MISNMQNYGGLPWPGLLSLVISLALAQHSSWHCQSGQVQGVHTGDAPGTPGSGLWRGEDFGSGSQETETIRERVLGR